MSSNPAEMFELTTRMKAGQEPDLARKVRRGRLIAIVILVGAVLAIGLLGN